MWLKELGEERCAGSKFHADSVFCAHGLRHRLWLRHPLHVWAGLVAKPERFQTQIITTFFGDATAALLHLQTILNNTLIIYITCKLPSPSDVLVFLSCRCTSPDFPGRREGEWSKPSWDAQLMNVIPFRHKKRKKPAVGAWKSDPGPTWWPSKAFRLSNAFPRFCTGPSRTSSEISSAAHSSIFEESCCQWEDRQQFRPKSFPLFSIFLWFFSDFPDSIRSWQVFSISIFSHYGDQTPPGPQICQSPGCSVGAPMAICPPPSTCRSPPCSLAWQAQ